MVKSGIAEQRIKRVVRGIIKEIMENGSVNDALGVVDEAVRDAIVDTERQKDILQNRIKQLELVSRSMRNADAEIRRMFGLQNGPVVGSYGSIVYRFPRPIQITDKNEFLQDDIEELFPELIRDAISVYIPQKNDCWVGIELSVEMDDLRGWE